MPSTGSAAAGSTVPRSSTMTVTFQVVTTLSLHTSPTAQDLSPERLESTTLPAAPQPCVHTIFTPERSISPNDGVIIEMRGCTLTTRPLVTVRSSVCPLGMACSSGSSILDPCPSPGCGAFFGCGGKWVIPIPAHWKVQHSAHFAWRVFTVLKDCVDCPSTVAEAKD
ncbi:hypothetical protein VTN31DRAFT_69 [Thermomyces dupontii]|uniref:uncharacterized protein n=1 Tax=Talaromyces thermophilus TaxID=28565 RepID=UPI0037428ED7